MVQKTEIISLIVQYIPKDITIILNNVKYLNINILGNDCVFIWAQGSSILFYGERNIEPRHHVIHSQQWWT